MHWWRKFEIGLPDRIGIGVVMTTAVLGLLAAVQPLASAAPLEPSTAPMARPQDLAGRPAGAAAVTTSSRWAHGQAIDRLRPPLDRPAPLAVTLVATSRSSGSDAPTRVVATGADPSLRTTLGSAVPASVRRWSDSIVKYARQHQVDPNLVAAVMATESQGNPNAVSPVGAIGLMQVMGGTYDPDANIRQGVGILAENLSIFGGNLELSLAAYNAGPAAVQRYGGIPPYPETQTYVYRVLNRYYLYTAS